MGSYEISPEQAGASAIRLMKEGRVNAVKIEGGYELCPAIKKITQAGIPVVGHIGLTPQKKNALGGFRVQGKNADSAAGLLRDALQIQDAGVFMCVLEAVPPEVASLITKKLDIPTIGIGAGNGCSGQVLVQADMTGNFEHGQSVPKFVKEYADVWSEATRGIRNYCQEVKKREFPTPEHTYALPAKELSGTLKSLGLVGQDQHDAQSHTTTIPQQVQKGSAGREFSGGE
jgi:3-methyl-2-oxobutanoate hydroxymethyltransferase